MSLKLFGKKRKATTCSCSQKAEQTLRPVKPPVGASIRILGSGCAKCRALEESVRGALADLGLDIPVEHTTDPAEIASWGVMQTPALAVNDTVVSSGRVLSRGQARSFLEQVSRTEG